ncbi:MAG: hypothetical protein ACK2T6_07635 [Anaerolineae bacterium]
MMGRQRPMVPGGTARRRRSGLGAWSAAPVSATAPVTMRALAGAVLAAALAASAASGRAEPPLGRTHGVDGQGWPAAVAADGTSRLAAPVVFDGAIAILQVRHDGSAAVLVVSDSVPRKRVQ